MPDEISLDQDDMQILREALPCLPDPTRAQIECALARWSLLDREQRVSLLCRLAVELKRCLSTGE